MACPCCCDLSPAPRRGRAARRTRSAPLAALGASPPRHSCPSARRLPTGAPAVRCSFVGCSVQRQRSAECKRGAGSRHSGGHCPACPWGPREPQKTAGLHRASGRRLTRGARPEPSASFPPRWASPCHRSSPAPGGRLEGTCGCMSRPGLGQGQVPPAGGRAPPPWVPASGSVGRARARGSRPALLTEAVPAGPVISSHDTVPGSPTVLLLLFLKITGVSIGNEGREWGRRDVRQLAAPEAARAGPGPVRSPRRSSGRRREARAAP